VLKPPEDAPLAVTAALTAHPAVRKILFTVAFTEMASRIVVGDGLDPRSTIGPVTTRAGYDKVLVRIRFIHPSVARDVSASVVRTAPVSSVEYRGAVLGFFPGFLSPERGHVQDGVGEVDVVQAPGVGRVGVEDLAAVA
jgi:hypothetical protein